MIGPIYKYLNIQGKGIFTDRKTSLYTALCKYMSNDHILRDTFLMSTFILKK